jgi:glyoxylase-like metal-dependent hydrolase (beta-lactamase superfamily II)
MIEKLFRDIYRIEIPLPNNPLKATNSYFIQGKDRNLLIDTGFNRSECQNEMDIAMREIGFSMDNTDLFITHIHGDHSGLTGYLAKPETKIYTGKYGAQLLMSQEEGINFKEFVIQSGLSEMGVSPEDNSIHQGLKYASGKITKADVIRDGDIIEVGDLVLRCIETTGHAPDHMCLYEPERKILFSGDHILGGITPNNTIWDSPWEMADDYLGIYLRNLEKIALLEIELTLPGYRTILSDCYGRIAELKIHHQKRLDNILKILGSGKMNGAEVAGKMRWDIKAKSWDEFPPAQKYFATGEALSHLTHLVFKKLVIKELYDGVVYYSINTKDQSDKY